MQYKQTECIVRYTLQREAKGTSRNNSWPGNKFGGFWRERNKRNPSNSQTNQGGERTLLLSTEKYKNVQ